ncbi:MAG: type II secretion system protein [bacterium]|nr:type II secretion system protein [bacterium]
MKQKGFGLLEIVIAVAIVGGALWALASVFLLAERAQELSREKLQAVFLAEEGLEVSRYLRDSGWNSNIAPLLTSTDYYLNFNAATSQWTTTVTAPAAIDGIFSRSFRIENVLRDSGDNIAPSGTNDPETRKIIMKVAWSFQQSSENVSLEAYLMDIFNN